MILSRFNYKRVLSLAGITLFFVQIISGNGVAHWLNSHAKEAYQAALEPFYRGKTRIELKNIKEVYEYFRKSVYRSSIIGAGLLLISLPMMYSLKNLFSLHKKVKEKRKLNQETTWQEDRYFEDMVKSALIIPLTVGGGFALLIQAAIANKIKQMAGQDLIKQSQ